MMVDSIGLVWYTYHMKTCIECKQDFDLDGFYRNRSRPDGRSQRCKSCDRAWQSRAYYKKQKADPGAHAQQRYYENIKHRYGMTSEQYEAMLKRQNGQCAVCPATQADSKKTRLHVDHDHQTGKVRGLLCTHCNQAIGCAKDSPDRLRELADYLEASS